LKALKVLSELSVPEILPPIIDTMENMKFNKNDVERICKKKTTEEKEDKENYTEKDEIKDIIVDILIQLKSPESINMLMDLYEEQEDPDKQDIIIFILKELKNITIAELQKIQNNLQELDKNELLIKILGQLNSEESLSQLLNIYDSKNKNIRKDIILALENFSSPRIIPYLINSLRDTNSNVVKLAARSLKKYIREPEVQLQIINEIKHGNKREREEIIKSLGIIGNESIIPVILESIKDNSRTVKVACLETLKNIEYLKYRDIIIKCLLELLQNEDIRWEVLLVLEKLSPPEILPDLIKFLKEENPEYREIARHGEKHWECRKIIARILGNIGSEEAVPIIIEALDEKQYFNRLVKQQSWSLLIEILSRIPSTDGIPYLIKSLQNDPAPLYTQAMSALVKLGEKVIPYLLKTYRANITGRKRIIEVFGLIGDSSSKTIIIDALSDEDEEVRRLAVIALGKLQCLKSLSLLKKSIKDSSEKVRATAIKVLWETNKKVDINIFIEALKDQKPKVRQIACEILGELKSTEAIIPLKKLLEDNYSEVREEAIKAVEKIESEPSEK